MTHPVAVLVALALAAACSDGGGGEPVTKTPRPPSTAAPGDDRVALELTEVARVDQPVALAARPGNGDLHVAEKTGRVRRIGTQPAVVVDISDEVSNGNEQGLLGLTFSPDGERMYISYTDDDGDTRIEEDDPATGSRREVFALDQPYANHNGGNIVFGPDGMLWLGLGDGGAGGDPEDRAQDPTDLLGKLVRFDPATWQPEIYAVGVRNPWRFSFDRATGDLWVGDVGQGAWEEIDLIPAGTAAGVNLGWPLAEGRHGYRASQRPADTLRPVYEYGHDVGQSVVGGHVYRGSAIAGLVGTYVFADTYTGSVWALDREDPEVVVDLALAVPGGLVSSFGEDAGGELYVMSLDGGVYRIDPR